MIYPVHGAGNITVTRGPSLSWSLYGPSMMDLRPPLPSSPAGLSGRLRYSRMPPRPKDEEAMGREYSILLEEVAARGLVRHTSAKFSPQNTSFFGKNKASVRRHTPRAPSSRPRTSIFPEKWPVFGPKSGSRSPDFGPKSGQKFRKICRNSGNRGVLRGVRKWPPRKPP